jgi:hypothetical protein
LLADLILPPNSEFERTKATGFVDRRIFTELRLQYFAVGFFDNSRYQHVRERKERSDADNEHQRIAEAQARRRAKD